MIRCVLLAAVTGLSTAALGQVNALNIMVSNTITPAQPSATVTVWASFDSQYFAFAQSAFSCIASPDAGGFSDPQKLLPFGLDGAVSPDQDRVDDAGAAQIQDLIAGIYADTSNPIAIWQVTWSTGDFSPRDIDITMDVSDFHVYLTDGGDWGDFLGSLEVGSGVIRVVPAPPLWALLGPGIALGARRRRSTAR